MFEGCDSLREITIPDSVKVIGGQAFENCTALSVISIPTDVTLIDISAFANCTSLKTVFYRGSRNQWKNISIEWNNEQLEKSDIIFEQNFAGDFTGDGKINAKDVTGIMKAIVKGGAENNPAADVNGDGKVNAKDVVALMKAIIAR